MSYKNRSADVLIKANGVTTKLMLHRNLPNGERAWKRDRVPKDPPVSPQAATEGSLIWESWHGGDGYGFVPSEPGKQLPVTAEGNLDCRWPGMMRLPPKINQLSGIAIGEAIRLFMLLDPTDGFSYVYVIAHDGTDYIIYRINPTDFTASPDVALTSGISTELVGDVVIFDGNAYILGNGVGVGSWKVTGDFTVTNHTGLRATVGTVTRDKMYFGGGASGLRSVTTGLDPTNSANWSADLSAGDDSMTITGLSGRGRLLYIALSGGLNAFDTDLNLVSLIPDLQGFRSIMNGRHMLEWHDAVVYPHIRGMFMHSEGVTTPIGLDQTRFNQTSLFGEVVGMIQEGEWLWIRLHMPARVFGDTARQALFAVRERKTGDPGLGPLIWYQLEEWQQSGPSLGTYIGETMTVEHEVTDVYGRGAHLWFIKGGDPSYINLPVRNMPPMSAVYASIINAASGFQLTGEKQLPTVDMAAPMVDKYLRSVEVDLETLDDDKYAEIYYAVDPQDVNPTWTLLGKVDQSGRTELLFPSDTTCRRVKLKAALTSNADTATPCVRRIALNYAERTRKNTVYTVACRVGRMVEDADGEPVNQNPETIVTRLEGYEDSKNIVQVTGPSGQQFNALALNVQTEENNNLDNEDEPYYTIRMNLMKVV